MLSFRPRAHLELVVACFLFTPMLDAQISGRGGTALGAFYDSSCTVYGYYNPARYYHLRAPQIDQVLQQNYNQMARRVRLPVWWIGAPSSDPYWLTEQDPTNCDIFYTNSQGTLNPLLTQNLNGLFQSLANKGYWEVLMSLAPQNGPHWTSPSWSGPTTLWSTYNQQILDMNINFAKNLFSHAFLNTNNQGIYVVADLGGEIVPPHGGWNCSNYVSGHCGDIRYHNEYGRTADYIFRFWNALANHMFTDGWSYFPGRNRIYGFSPDPAHITGMYQIYDLPGSAGRPYVFPIGMYPSPNSRSAAYDMFLQVHNAMLSVGDSLTGFIIAETWYNDDNTAVGFENAITATGRGVHFLIQWPMAPNGSLVVPLDYFRYRDQGF